MNELVMVVTQHPKPFIELLAAYWVFSAFVSSMPVPDPGAVDFRRNVIYQSVFTFFHTLSGSLKTAVNDPRLQTLIAKKNGNTEK